MENQVDRKERTVFVTGMNERFNEDVLYETLRKVPFGLN